MGAGIMISDKEAAELYRWLISNAHREQRDGGYSTYLVIPRIPLFVDGKSRGVDVESCIKSYMKTYPW